MLRRTLILALPLMSCATGAKPTAAQVIADLTGAVTTLDAMTQMPAFAGLVTNPATLAQIRSAVAQAKTALATLNASLPDAANATGVQQVFAYLNAALSLLAGLGVLPAPYGTVVAAVSVLLPLVEAWLGGVGVPRAPALAGPRVAPAGMSAEKARQVLSVGAR